MIKFVDPRGVVSTPEQSYDLSRDVRLNDGEGITVALLANGFPDSESVSYTHLRAHET